MPSVTSPYDMYDNDWVKIAAAGAIPHLVALLGAHNTAAVQVMAASPWI